MRKVIAKAMMQSLGSMAQLTHTLTFDCAQIQNLRKLYKEQGEALGLHGVSLGDMVMFAVARTLAKPEHRALNANLLDGTHHALLPRRQLGLCLRYRARADGPGDLRRGQDEPQADFGRHQGTGQGPAGRARSTRTSCRGAFVYDLQPGARWASRASRPSSIRRRRASWVWTPSSRACAKWAARSRSTRPWALSLTYDHRAVDGMPASKFLADLKFNLENFLLLLAKG